MGTVAPGTRYVLGSTTEDERLLVTASTKQDAIWVYEAAGRLDALTTGQPLFTREMKASQREAGDFFPAGGCDLVLISEDRTVWRLPNQVKAGRREVGA